MFPWPETRTGLSRRVLFAAVAVAPARALAASCCGPVTLSGRRLAAFLDGTDVDRLWLPSFKVDWKTGATIAPWGDGRAHTHCSAFVASVAMRLGVYVLRPPEHGQNLLANAQMGWLRSNEAVAAGWHPMPDVRMAQTWANAGDLVLAVFENPDPLIPGHIAIVRPSDIDASSLRVEGPFVTQAGGHNRISVPLAHGFADHVGAWISLGGGSVRFFVHTLNWAAL